MVFSPPRARRSAAAEPAGPPPSTATLFMLLNLWAEEPEVLRHESWRGLSSLQSREWSRLFLHKTHSGNRTRNRASSWIVAARMAAQMVPWQAPLVVPVWQNSDGPAAAAEPKY